MATTVSNQFKLNVLPVGNTTLDIIAASMLVGEWMQLTGITGLTYFLDSAAGGVGHILPYADRCPYDPVRRRAWFTGSDDPGAYRHSLYYDVETNSVVLVNEILFGSPGVNHGGTVTIDVANRKYIIYSYAGTATAYYNLDADGPQTSTSLGTQPWGASGPHAMCYFPEQSALFYVTNDKVYRRLDSTGTWVTFLSLVTSIHRVCHYNAYHQCLVLGGGNTTKDTMRRISANGTVTVLGAPPNEASIFARSEWVEDTETGDFHVLVNGNGEMARYSYNPSTDVWTPMSITGVPSIILSGTGTTLLMAVATAIPECNVHLWMAGSGSTIQFWLYKYAA